MALLAALNAGALGLLLAVAGPAAAQPPAPAPMALASPADPGPRLPPRGRSLFDELFGIAGAASAGEARADSVPEPFPRLLEALEREAGPASIQAVLIPYGRSLQRMAAAPDFIGSPRVVLAVDRQPPTADARGLHLRDRLFIGYQARSGGLEIISYNEDAGRFEFQVLEGYGGPGAPVVRYAERSVCVSCHQGHGPLFPTAPWDETNANPALAAELQAIAPVFHGVRVGRGVDTPDAIDAATDRASRILLGNRLWEAGCGEAGAPEARRCRGALLEAALRYRLAGSPAAMGPGATTLGARLARQLAAHAPGGLGIPSPDLPNRDPQARIAAGLAREAAVAAAGPFDPARPRPLALLWSPTGPPAELYDIAVRQLADAFAAADIVALDRALEQAASRAGKRLAQRRAICRLGRADIGGEMELRLDCRGDATLNGHLRLAQGRVTGGRVRALSLGGNPAIHWLDVAAGPGLHGDPPRLRIQLARSAQHLSPRLPDGARVQQLELQMEDDGRAALALTLSDESPLLTRAIAAMAEAPGPYHLLGGGPPRRRALLDALHMALATVDGAGP